MIRVLLSPRLKPTDKAVPWLVEASIEDQGRAPQLIRYRGRLFAWEMVRGDTRNGGAVHVYIEAEEPLDLSEDGVNATGGDG